MHTELLNQSFNNHKIVLWLLCDIWLVCFGSVLISFCVLNLYLCRSANSGTTTRQAHTGNMCRLTVRQADRRRALRGWEGQMFPCRHRGEMFAMPGLCLPGSPQSHQLAAWRLEPVSAGERTGGREALTYTQEMKEGPQMSCVSPGAKGAHLTQPCPVEKDLFYSLGWSVDARGTRLVSLEAKLNVRAAMEAADLTRLP